MKKNLNQKFFAKRAFAAVLSAAVAITALPVTLPAMTEIVMAQNVAVTQGPIDESLVTPFGDVFNYDQAKDVLGLVWGAAGYDMYAVTITGIDTDYEANYEFGMGYHEVANENGNYIPGKTYAVALQGIQGDVYSPAKIVNMTIPGGEEAAPETPNTETPNTETPNTETPVVETTYVNLQTATASTYRSQDDGGWGGDSNVIFTFNGEKADISADNFGGNAWAVQWGLSQLTSSAEKNVLEFDVTAETDGKLLYKLINDEGMTEVALKGGETTHVVIKTNRQAVSPFFDLSFLGAGKNTFENMIFAENTLPEEEAPETAEEIKENNDALDLSALLEAGQMSTYDSQNDGGWGGNTPVTFNFDGKNAFVSAESFGWNAWAVQWKLLNLESDADTNLFEFDVVADSNKSFNVKNENTGTMTTVSLTAGKIYHFAELVSADTVSYTLDLTGGAGELHFANVNFAPVANIANVVTELYCSQDDGGWGGDNNVRASYDGTKAVIKADGFGWNAWAVQWKLALESTKEANTFEFDVVADADKSFNVKNENTSVMTTVTLKAGQTYHFAENVSGKSVAYTFDLTGGDKNVLTFTNMRFGDAGTAAPVVVNPKDGQHNFADDENNALYDNADPGIGKDGYSLVWADEFDGNYGSNVDPSTGLNLDNWAYQLGDGTTDCGNYGWGNNELQCYTANRKNIAVNEDLTGDGEADGFLRITAAYEEDGYKYAGEGSKKYTSARIRTTEGGNALFNSTYGYYEARIALPEVQGAWPAFWMLPESTEVYGGWPVSGEIDILETTGTHADAACGTLHWGTPTHVYKGSGYVSLNSEVKYFHTYAINWEPGQIEWIYDGEVIYTSTDWASGISGASDSLSFDAPFDQPFYTILNLAVDSGQFGGSANKAKFDEDINMYVDYVRCYQKTEGYADQVKPSVQKSAKDDWADYAGINQIAEIAEGKTDSTGGGLADASTTDDVWYFSNQDDASGKLTTTTDADGKTWAVVDVTKSGGQDYSVQLIGHYNAKAGYTYKVSFDAYAEGDLVGKTVACDSKEWSGWSTYGVSQVKLESTTTSYAFAFNQTENFDKCRIEFNLGARATGKVYISNVRVEIIDPATIADVTGGRHVLAGGEMLYNGSFDQGVYHLGYWTAGNGTTVSVPRYTSTDLTGHDVNVIDIASMTNYEGLEGGKKFYERRAQISAEAGVAPQIYQTGFNMGADTYTGSFDMYSETDSAVKVSIYSTKEEGGIVTLDEQIITRTYNYSASEGVKTINFGFITLEDIENAAIVYTFAKGTSVQLDNASLKGANQGVQVKEEAIDETVTWAGDDGNGNAISLIQNDGVISMKNITSGATWYSWQLTSSNFVVAAGYDYKLSFDYKLEGNTNNTFKYIVQQNGGDWAAVKDVTEVTYNAADGEYNHYEVTFKCGVTLDDCHLVYGFGNSAAGGENMFSVKNVSLRVQRAGDSDEGATDDNSDDVNDDVFAPETPGTEEPGTEEPGTEEPGTEEPGTEEPGTEEPGTEEPGTEEPGTEEPGTEEPGETEKPEEEVPATPITPAKPNKKVEKVIKKIEKAVKKVEKAVEKVIKIIGKLFK